MFFFIHYSFHTFVNLYDNFSLIINLKNVLVMVIAENMETKIPMARVIAKPLTKPVVKKYKITQVIKEEIFESRMLGQAREKPCSMAAEIGFPSRSSSFMRSKIRILASTAMPIDKINPATPAKVKVTGISLNKANTIIV